MDTISVFSVILLRTFSTNISPYLLGLINLTVTSKIGNILSARYLVDECSIDVVTNWIDFYPILFRYKILPIIKSTLASDPVCSYIVCHYYDGAPNTNEFTDYFS